GHLQPSNLPLPGPSGRVHAVAFSPDGKLLAAGSWNDARTTAWLWNAGTRRPINLPSSYQTYVNAVAFSPNGKILAALGGNGDVQLWDVPHRQLLAVSLVGTLTRGWTVAFSPDGKTMAVGGCELTDSDGICTNGGIDLWDVARQQLLWHPLTGALDSVNSVAFSPDGKILASGSRDGTVQLWDMASRRPLGAPLRGHTSTVNSVAFSPNGALLASGSEDTTVRLWDVATRKPDGPPLRGHVDQVESVAFSPDGSVLASGADDRTIRLWDVASGQPLGLPLTGHSDDVLSVAFSPAGASLASGSFDHTVRLWSVDPTSWRQEACGIANRNLTPQEWRQYLGSQPYHITCPLLGR
ncbi:MAG TPA: WD40 repeat domain-containing protein, partial [Chloroflexota bacterium]|nr:WD40 repeat domain-containing protein [Chloroflexota bacterium]